MTDALRNEVILSKTVLERLEVIDQDFPNARARGHELPARGDKRYPNPDPGWGCDRTPKGSQATGSLPEEKEVQGSLPASKEVKGVLPRNAKEIKGVLPKEIT